MTLRFNPFWAPFTYPLAEDAATGAHLRILVGNTVFTTHKSRADGTLSEAPHLSAYPLAMWLAWHWWRLLWEPSHPGAFRDRQWLDAHNLRRTGGGYVWPDITFASDGHKIMVLPKSTQDHPARPISYMNMTDKILTIPYEGFEGSVDEFIQSTIEQLNRHDISKNNLATLFNELNEERENDDMAIYRRLEAMLGCDPDDGDETTISRMLADIDNVGEPAIRELAARGAAHHKVSSVADLREAANRLGFSGRRGDAAKPLSEDNLTPYGAGPAWQRGVEAARALRARETLGNDPIGDARLAEIAGVSREALRDTNNKFDFSFEIAETDGAIKLVHRSKWETGRRFELSRMIADAVAVEPDARLRSVTDVSTYRQQLQKAFAAEFLAPIEGVEDYLNEEYEEGVSYDEDQQKDVSERYNVSPMTINSLLKNNRKIERSDYEVLDHLSDAA